MNHAPTPRPALIDDLSFLIARARSITSGAANRGLDQFGLKVRSYSVLALACEESTLTQRETAAFLCLDPSQIVSIIDDLESRDLVARVPSHEDRRRKVLRATEAGRALFNEAQKAAAKAEEEVFSHLAADEREHLLALLKNIAFRDSSI